MMVPISAVPSTSILLIDGSENERAYWSDQLTRSSDYEIVEAVDGESGLALYRSRRINCVVLELSLPDQSGLQTLVELVPRASRPEVAVIILTRVTHRAVWELAKQTGAYACLAKQFTSGDDLENSIQRAIEFVRLMRKEERTA
jgi:DNA-binding NarL/FixJ family response regulator